MGARASIAALLFPLTSDVDLLEEVLYDEKVFYSEKVLCGLCDEENLLSAGMTGFFLYLNLVKPYDQAALQDDTAGIRRSRGQIRKMEQPREVLCIR